MAYVSVASLWELTIKSSLGKLRLPLPVLELAERCKESGFEILSIEPYHLRNLEKLPWVHRDPFDRLLIAQAQSEHLTFVTGDEWIRQYPVETLWD